MKAITLEKILDKREAGQDTKMAARPTATGMQRKKQRRLSAETAFEDP